MSPLPLHTPLWLCMQRTHDSLFFIALSYILQAAKDILYWKGNASHLQTVLIRQYRLCTDIENSAGCYMTVPLCPIVFLWFDSIDGKLKQSIEFSCLPDWKTHQNPSLISLLSAVTTTVYFHVTATERFNYLVFNTVLISDFFPPTFGLRASQTQVWLLISVSRLETISLWMSSTQEGVLDV